MTHMTTTLKTRLQTYLKPIYGKRTLPSIITNDQIWNIHYLARTIFTTNLSTFHVPLSVFCTTEAFPCSQNHCMPRRRWVDSAMPETLTQIVQVILISILIPGIVWTNPPVVNVTIVRKHSHSWLPEKKGNSYSKPFFSKLLPRDAYSQICQPKSKFPAIGG